MAGAKGQHLLLTVDEDLCIVNVRKFFEAGRVDADLPLTEGNSRFAQLREELAADDLEPVEDGVRDLFDLFI